MLAKLSNKAHSEASEPKESHCSGFRHGASPAGFSIMGERSKLNSCVASIILSIEESVKVSIIDARESNMKSAILTPSPAVMQITGRRVIGIVSIVCIANSANISIIAGIKLGIPSRINAMGGEKIRCPIDPMTIGMAVDIYAGSAIRVISGRHIKGHTNHDIMKGFIGADDIEIKGT